ncbi:MAG: YfhO family protein [Paludibacter sp.]|nr:YfhO family protein [Paludibacter sp.]
MNKQVLSKFTPHIVAVLLFTIISFFYFKPVLEGKQLIGHDTESWMYMAKETIDYNESHDDITLWTNSMFGGMPTYQISMTQPYNIMNYVEKVIQLYPGVVFKLMLYLIGFYILLLAFGMNPWLALAGSVAFSFASYNFIILAAGHNSKAITIAYMAPLIGGVYMAFRRKKLLGSVVTAIFLSLAIRANHVQILYYTLIILLVFGIVEFIYSIRNKEIKSFLQSTGLVLVAAIIAVGINATSLLTTYEYSQYTMRGKSNGLTVDTQNSQHGLNKDYITGWSYGKAETLTLLIPDFMGGASAGHLDADSETGQKLKSLGASNVSQIMKENQFPLYWGDQPFTSGPVYLGAVVIFLFVLGLFVVERRTLWWLIPTILLTLMLSWGHNFMWLTDIFIDHFPMYNKFRTVSMTLVATGFGITLVALLALKEVLKSDTDKKKLIKPVMISAGITAGISLLFGLIPSLAGNFVAPGDAQLSGGNAFLQETLPLDRMALLRSDAFRSMGFILFAAAVLWLYLNDKLKNKAAIAIFGILFLADLMPIAKRYLNDDNFTRKRKIQTLVEPSKADQMVLQDRSDYRVLDATVNIFNDAKPSYFHKNIGGYHAAKLRRYQELINMQLDGEIGQLFSSFGRAKSFDDLQPALDSLGVLNMLNMKYIIYNKDAAPILNPYANGNAWFVDKVFVAADANEEMKKLGEIDTKHELVADKEYAAMIPANLSVDDSTASIVLKSYEPNHLIYNFSSKTDQLAVFSEIYYDKGWNAYINGKKVPYFRADYLLRAMPLKAGNYEVEFKFEPASYRIGNTIALTSDIILVLSLLGLLFFQLRQSKKK